MKVGVIGLGIGGQHVRDYLDHPAVDSVVVNDLDPRRSEVLAAELDRVEIARQTDDLFADEAVKIVSVCSYDDAHHEQIVAGLRRGKHIYAEKPLCQTPAQAREIAGLLREGTARLSSNMVLRTCPLFVGVKEALGRGEFGDVFSMDADYLWGRTEKLTRGWRNRMENYSIIQGAAVHMIDLVMWLIETRPVSVSAHANGLVTGKQGGRFPDFASLSLIFANGMIARIGAYGGCVHPHFHRLRVFGEKKTFTHDPTGSYWLDSCEPGTAGIEAEGAYPGREFRPRALHSFVDEVLYARPALVRQGEVFDVMAVCFAAEQSVREGGPVAVTY
ncbi:putative oxidoreductase YvaA [Pseudodesulfovibrio hydrargyri]|uniref:Putative oxidoreductase YvaA n=1 Tax=Pseudodesulfovibrio hydrargyri TaxID=2125990 RepID=A0A1J5MVR2_9BACT|nr:Gfo/Idh/MocA family oxidoreductase [Pseudodesulfovibrio hydrargyri]OIQ50066.1 putative oxidoreductase YvaA [Pseudodesulfovibrio hydrargyri]